MNLDQMCDNLRRLQRQRTVVLKSRNMQANRLQAVVAGTLGYSSMLAENERQKKFREASALIKGVMAGKVDHEFSRIIVATMTGIDAFNAMKKRLESEMLAVAKLLPVAPWVMEPEQRGFGLPFLAIVIGETGNLCDYPAPGKVWRRLGCAPWTFDGKTRMGATWRSGREGKLPKAEWDQFGYSPRRRSIAYLIGEGIVKQNFVQGGDSVGETDADPADLDEVSAGEGAGEAVLETEWATAGPYRRRYDEVKAKAIAERPDWSRCPKCEGKGKVSGKKCGNCKGTGKVLKRCHLHGMLLATKLLLKRLWIEWHRSTVPGWKPKEWAA